MASTNKTLTEREAEELEASFAKISNWWISVGHNLDDFSRFPAEQPIEKDIIDPIPERLCYIMITEARGPYIDMADDLTEDDCSPRLLAGWKQSKYSGDDINRFDSFRPARPIHRPKDQHVREYGKTKSRELLNMQNTLSVRNERWRWSNGPLCEKLGCRLSKIPEKYQVPLLRLSNAQHFFRVIGDIVVEDFARGIFQMTPPYDFNQKTAGIPTIRYELPKPKEIHPMIRKVFLDRGRVLPTLAEFLQHYPEILNHLFTDGVIPGEQADEVEAFNHSQAMEAYNAAEARGENVPKPKKHKKEKAKNQHP